MSRGSGWGSSLDVLVVGGGPAGATAARLLALRGHSVGLLSRPPCGARDLAESVPPSTRRLFEELGASEAMDAAGFPRSGGNTVAWAAVEPRHVSFADGLGWQVTRSELARLLLDLAARAGTAVREVVAAEVREEEEGLRVILADGQESVRARILLDCSGRAGLVASSLRVRERAERTVALVGVWTGGQNPGAAVEGDTLVESYRDGWAWSIRVNLDRRYATAMVDPDLTDLCRSTGLEGVYRAELAKTKLVSEALEGAERVGGLTVWGATPYSVHRFCGPGFLLVGDAAAFIDPLSSYGVKRALASGWLASVTAHTILKDPSREAIALRFFQERESDAVRSYHNQAAAFYRAGTRAHDHAFWGRRADAGQEVTGDRPLPADGVPFDERASPPSFSARSGVVDVERLRKDRRVLAAFRRIRATECPDLRPGPRLSWTESPRIREGEIVLEPQLTSPSFPNGFRFFRDIDAVRLVRIVEAMRLEDPTCRPGVGSVYEAYAGKAGTSLPDFLGALSVLLAEGVLADGDGTHADHPQEVGMGVA